MRYTINLVTKTYIDQRLIRRVILACIATMLILTSWNVIRMSSNMGELRRLTTEITSFEEKLNNRSAGVSENDFNRQLASISFFNEIIIHKTYNWLGLLEQLENTIPEGVALTSLAQDDKKIFQVKIEGRAKNFGLVRTYMEKLEDSKKFTDILLLSTADEMIGEKKRSVRFSISFRKVEP